MFSTVPCSHAPRSSRCEGLDDGLASGAALVVGEFDGRSSSWKYFGKPPALAFSSGDDSVVGLDCQSGISSSDPAVFAAARRVKPELTSIFDEGSAMNGPAEKFCAAGVSFVRGPSARRAIRAARRLLLAEFVGVSSARSLSSRLPKLAAGAASGDLAVSWPPRINNTATTTTLAIAATQMVGCRTSLFSQRSGRSVQAGATVWGGGTTACAASMRAYDRVSTFGSAGSGGTTGVEGKAASLDVAGGFAGIAVKGASAGSEGLRAACLGFASLVLLTQGTLIRTRVRGSSSGSANAWPR